jgi:predicted nucleic-acid-binding protein
MIAVDTNVWVRYLTNDDPAQAERVLHLLDQATEVFLPTTVLLELEWVLRVVYGLSPAAVQRSLLQVLGLPMVVAEAPARFAKALELHAEGFDFADALHLAASEGCQQFITFDGQFVRKGAQTKPPVWMVP